MAGRFQPRGQNLDKPNSMNHLPLSLTVTFRVSFSLSISLSPSLPSLHFTVARRAAIALDLSPDSSSFLPTSSSASPFARRASASPLPLSLLSLPPSFPPQPSLLSCLPFLSSMPVIAAPPPSSVVIPSLRSCHFPSENLTFAVSLSLPVTPCDRLILTPLVLMERRRRSIRDEEVTGYAKLTARRSSRPQAETPTDAQHHTWFR